MVPLLATVRAKLFGVSLEEALVPASRFPVSPSMGGEGFVRTRLGPIVATFLEGYHHALRTRDLDRLCARLDEGIALERRGFAYEGAGMGLAVVDSLLPRRARKLERFFTEQGRAHLYLILVGAGWALARVPLSRARHLAAIRSAEPELHWLTLDGVGFYSGFHDYRGCIERGVRPSYLRGYELRAFDQGLGRSLWFSCVGDRSAIDRTIDLFPPARRSDLWSGVGLACAYAGGETEATVRVLYDAAGPEAPVFAQGVAFAAAARRRAGNPSDDTSIACRITWNQDADDVADQTLALWDSLTRTDRDDEAPSYEAWRTSLADLHRSRAVATHGTTAMQDVEAERCTA